MSQEYDRALAVLGSGTTDQLEALCHEINAFPDGVDSFLGRRWIINAIDVGSRLSVEWMLGKSVDLDFRDEEGYTPLHAVIDRGGPDRHRLLELLLVAGAPINRKGLNDWTPAHTPQPHETMLRPCAFWSDTARTSRYERIFRIMRLLSRRL